ncbi:hypothetical protein ACVWWJ_002654 [Luteibacter sp. HA06]
MNDDIDTFCEGSPHWGHAVMLAATYREAASTRHAAATALGALSEHLQQLQDTLEMLRKRPALSPVMGTWPRNEPVQDGNSGP